MMNGIRKRTVGLWLSGPPGCGKSHLYSDVLPVIAKAFGAQSSGPKSILTVKCSGGGFFDKVTEHTRVIVFDDFSPDSRNSQEFLRLISKGLSRELNVKFGTEVDVTLLRSCLVWAAHVSAKYHIQYTPPQWTRTTG